MSFKSYAQGGQFGTYQIDLPIKAEINEDLRAAGNFAKQMELSQQYREKWAGNYLTALNEKSSIERQNRDDNFEFLQNNFKRIHEGEQREFEGRLAEMQREQAEAANAEPGFIEKLIPLLMELAPMALDVIGGYMARGHEQALEETSAAGRKLIRHYQENGQNLIPEVNKVLLLGGEEQRAHIAKLAYETKIPQETLNKFFNQSGIYRLSSELISAENITRASYLRIDAARQGMPVEGDKNLALINYSNQIEQQQEIDNELLRIQTEMFGGKVSDNVTAFLDKSNGKFKNQLRNQESGNWERRNEDANQAVYAYEVGNAAATGGFGTWFRGQTKIHERGGAVPTPVARVQSLELFNKHYSGTAADYQRIVGRDLQETLKLKEIPAPGSTKFGGVWDTYNKNLLELRGKEVSAAREQVNAVKLQSDQVVETGKQYTLNNPEKASQYWQTLANSTEMDKLTADAQKYIQTMASNPEAIRKFVRTQNSVEFKTGLTDSDQNKLAYKAMEPDLGVGAAKEGWEDNNITLKNRLISYAKIKFPEIMRQNPSMDPSVAFETAVTMAWSEMLSSGNVKIIDDGDPTTPITTNWSSGSTKYNNYEKNQTLFRDRIKGAIKNAPSVEDIYFRAEFHNSDGILKSVNTVNTLWKSQNQGMDITPQHVQVAVNSTWIQDITNEYRKAGRDVSASQVLNEQGEAWAEKTGQKWEPIDYVTQDDLNKASARARRDLAQIHPMSIGNDLVQAHRSGQPYQLSPHAISSSFRVTGTFGEPRGYGQEHAGADNALPQRTPVLAKKGGVVSDAGFTGTGAGGEVFIDNGNGYDSRILHMNEIAVQPGQRIKPGDFLGYSGGAVGTKGAGHSTGPHLHTEIRLNGQLLDPLSKDSNGTLLDQFFGVGVR